MTSINTNIAAQTALRTLQSTNAQLDQTQGRISTGLKIGEAKDNAAYWSISTSLKSDNKALGAVKDSLGLGAATVDTAYQGLNRTLDVLDEIKSKLMTAQQSGLPRSVIQDEISELQKQLQSIANSSIFSGENWLSINSDAPGFSAEKEVVASFTRDANNAVSIGKVNVDISNVALFDSSAAVGKNGILDGAISLKGPDGRDLDLGPVNIDGNRLTGGLTNTAANAGDGVAAQTGTAKTAVSLGGATSSTATYAAGTITDSGSNYTAGDVIEVTFGSAGVVTVNVDDLITANTLTYADILAGDHSGLTGITLTSGTGGSMVVTNTATGSAAASSISAVAFATGSTNTNNTTFTPPSAPVSPNVTTGASSTGAVVETDALTVGDFAQGDVVKLTILNGATEVEITTAALGASPSLNDIRDAINARFTAQTAGITASVVGSDIVFTADATTTAKAAFSLTSFTVTNAAGSGKSVTNDIGMAATSGTVDGTLFAAMTLDADDNLYFKVAVDGGAAKEVKIDRALVNTTLNRDTGAIANVTEYRDVVRAALTNAGVTGVTVTADTTANSENLIFTSNTAGATSNVAISDVRASAGADTVTVMSLNISDAGLAAAGASTGAQISNLLSAYVSAVSETITKVTNAASTLGSVASRIEMQQTFVSNLMDTIDNGISGLIDADMNEESTRLQALQVKQQLGVQALSIANQSAQNVLRLFQ